MKIENGTLYLVDDKDYVYNGYNKIDEPEYTYDEVGIAYYQGEINKYSCSLHAAITVVSNNCDFRFTITDREKILKKAMKQGFDPTYGWYMNKAVKCVVDYCNEELGLDLVYIRVPHEQIPDLCDRGFGVVSGYSYMYGMAQDRDDGTLGEYKEDINDYGKTIYGHLVSFWTYRKRNDQHSETNTVKTGEKHFGFVDNYFPKHKNNETFIENYDHLVKIGSFFPSGYIIVPKKNTKPKTIQAFKQKIKDFRKIIK